eukprot:655342_1
MRCRTVGINKALSLILGVHDRLIEMQRPVYIPNGIRLVIYIPITSKEINYVTKYTQILEDAKESGTLQSSIKSMVSGWSCCCRYQLRIWSKSVSNRTVTR